MSDSIRLMHYDPRWRQEFQQTRSSILHSCEGWVSDVHHIGSTAISGIIARPIVDCAVVVPNPDGFDEATVFIEGLNFRLQKNPKWLSGGRFLTKPRAGEATHHVYLFIEGEPILNRMLAVRNLLQDNRELALRFEETKVHHWKCSEGDASRYEEIKTAFFETVQ